MEYLSVMHYDIEGRPCARSVVSLVNLSNLPGTAHKPGKPFTTAQTRARSGYAIGLPFVLRALGIGMQTQDRLTDAQRIWLWFFYDVPTTDFLELAGIAMFFGAYFALSAGLYYGILLAIWLAGIV